MKNILLILLLVIGSVGTNLTTQAVGKWGGLRSKQYKLGSYIQNIALTLSVLVQIVEVNIVRGPIINLLHSIALIKTQILTDGFENASYVATCILAIVAVYPAFRNLIHKSKLSVFTICDLKFIESTNQTVKKIHLKIGLNNTGPNPIYIEEISIVVTKSDSTKIKLSWDILVNQPTSKKSLDSGPAVIQILKPSEDKLFNIQFKSDETDLWQLKTQAKDAELMLTYKTRSLISNLTSNIKHSSLKCAINKSLFQSAETIEAYK